MSGAFFEPEELMMQLQHNGAATIDEDTATLLSELASDAVRDYLIQQVDYVEDDEVTLYGDNSELVVLQERPVLAVTSVLLAGQPVPAYDWRDNGALRRVIYPGSQYANMQCMYWPWGVPVKVTYTHGYKVVPNIIKAAALDIAVSTYSNPNPLVTAKTVDDVTEMYRVSKAASMLSDERRQALDRYGLMDV